jgi:hypothetical protein
VSKQYRKKPVVIEAMQFDGTEASAVGVISWMGSNAKARYFEEDTEIRVHGEVALIAAPARIRIRTLEGDMFATPGDFIIKGVQGEFYPCKPDIFAATYEEA